ncbi:MAG TPA: 50S ribosomal protein L15 [Planctomycetaceae bacterium]|jgi:large subunit ribosomal protein L15|nr:50S ribosomal protein L15 [Planctomycetaceae bacterium]
MQINDVHRGIQKNKSRKRVGRGIGSGHGKTAGRGDKGHSAHSGHAKRFAFEGGQKQAFRRVAKFGFSNNFFTRRVAEVNVSALEARFESGAVVDEAALRAAGLVKGEWDSVKILAKGELTKKLTVKVNDFSAGAEAKITAVGGTVERVL